MIFNSIKWGLQLWHGLILALLLTGFGLAAYNVARQNQWQQLDQELANQLEQVTAQTIETPTHGPPAGIHPVNEPDPSQYTGTGIAQTPPPPPEPQPPIQTLINRITAFANTNYYLVLWNNRGEIIAKSTNAPAHIPAPPPPTTHKSDRLPADHIQLSPAQLAIPGGPIQARLRADHRELAVTLPGGEILLAGRHAGRELTSLRLLTLKLAGAGLCILCLGLLGGWWIANNAIRPIRDISTTALKIASGDLSQRISIANTKNELGQLASVLNSTFSRLETAFKQQTRFVSDAAHELRTPLSIMLSQIQTALAKQRPAEEYREALEACHRATQRMRKLVETLLELAKFDSGQHQINRVPIDLAQIALEHADLLQPLAAERYISIHTNLQPTPCQGDPVRIAQLITNLVTNAIQFNKDAGGIMISTRLENGFAILTVSDTGHGIPPQDLPHVFDRFYRADRARSRPFGSTGLGLAICKAIVDAHGGFIEITSQPGIGTTVTVRIPAEQPNQTTGHVAPRKHSHKTVDSNDVAEVN